ncbi:MAG: PKD domain-containing protein [Saprospiraceae bacterium]|nr:PKD domain-containing protein [Saprospiraceae bacterium]
MIHFFQKNIWCYSIGVIFILLQSCTPDRINENSIDGTPNVPDFTITPLADNPNKLVVTSLATDAFQIFWDAPGGTPKSSKRLSDTILYTKKGTYTISLYASSTDGSGTAVKTKTITLENDAALECNSKIAMLTGDCLPSGKCWTLAQEAGAVKVGPTYDDFSWFTSTAGGLQPAQYDDRFCFTFEGLVFENRNNGTTINPWDGYKVQNVDHGISDFIFSEGTGISNRDQIILQDNQFVGVWDSDNVLDIVTLTADKLVIRARLRAQNGTTAAEGWFELTFAPN